MAANLAPLPLPASLPQQWQGLMTNDLEKIREGLLGCIAPLFKTKMVAASALRLTIKDRLLLSTEDWANLLTLCPDMATRLIASAAQNAELASSFIESGDYGRAFTAHRQSVFEAGEVNGIIETMRARSSAGARAKHAEDVSEEAEAREHWKRHIKPLGRKITREAAAQQLVEIVPVQLSTAKTYMRKWEKEEQTAKISRTAREKIKTAFPSLFPDPRRR